jgi:hypothetical protein
MRNPKRAITLYLKELSYSINMIERNLFMYWTGDEYKLVNILKNIVYLYSKVGMGYTPHLITDENLLNYVPNLPPNFNALIPQHKADYVRVYVVYTYGGIWLDADALVMGTLDAFFQISMGFIIREPGHLYSNCFFGFPKHAPYLKLWLEKIESVLIGRTTPLHWTEIGSSLMNEIEPSGLQVINAVDTLYPVIWTEQVEQYLRKPYHNYIYIERKNQPLMMLTNAIYKEVESIPLKRLLYGHMPLNYFINKAYASLPLIDYDFIEIGTSNFDTLIQEAKDTTVGLSIDIIKYYLDRLPTKPNVRKLHFGISDRRRVEKAYYIPEHLIEQYQLPDWLRGCNSIGGYHPRHLDEGRGKWCSVETVQIITPMELFVENRVRKVRFLKIDTEGHDCVILKSLYKYILYLPYVFYPIRIQFETNELTPDRDVDEIIHLYTSIGYHVVSRGRDTVLELDGML